MLSMSIMLIYFMPFHIFFASFPSIACLLVSCLCLCLHTHGVRTCRARARFPKRKQKVVGTSMSQAVIFSRFRSLVFPFGYVLF